MRRLFAVSLCLIFASSVQAAPAPELSWGKPGVSFDQYRQDAVECGREGYYLDISKTDDAQEFVKASRQLDALNGTFSGNTTGSSGTGPASTDAVDQMARFAATQQHVIERVRPEQRFRNIKKTLQSTIDQCLVRRGYSQFRLSSDQRHQLRKLKAGSEARHVYLYRLASDPAVLSKQSLPPAEAQ